MNVSLSDISSYIQFLIKKQRLYVSIHGRLSDFDDLARYNFHRHPHCLYVKTVCSCWDECIYRQKKVIKKCEKGDFFGICYAGVGEFVYPIRVNGDILGFISVCGYKGEEDLTRIKQKIFAERYAVSTDELYAQFEKLEPIPDKSEIDTLIRPLVNLCESFYSKYSSDFSQSTELISKVLRYVNEHHTSHIAMEDISRKFNYSVSALSHLFKKHTGMSLSKYVENLRIEDAKWLLKQPDLRIVEIASLLGFCNSGYFSSVFKKNVGLSPKQFQNFNKR